MKNTIKASEIIRNSWDWHGKSTQEFNIDGKIIKTNLNGSDQYWNGTDIPVKYTRANNGIHYKAHKSRSEELDDCIAEGFDEIRFVLYASKMIRGYCEVFVWAHKSKKAQEAESSRKAHELVEKISQMDAGEVCKAVEESLAEIHADQAQAELKGINPEKTYHVVMVNKETNEQTVCGSWSGHGMMRGFKAGFGGFYMEDEQTIWFATEEPENDAPAQEQEINQPEPENATESKSEPHSQPVHHLNGAPRLIAEPQEDADAQEREKAFQRELAKIRKRKEKLIPREMIDAYNRLSDSLKGTAHYALLKMYHEFKDVDGKFKGLSWGLPREHMITIDGEEFYIKKIKNAVWLYWEFRGDVERWLLTDQAKAYFNIANESNPEPSQSSSDEEKEITQENTEELTDAKPEPQGMAHHTRIKLNFSLSALRAKRNELARIQWHEYTTRGNTERCQSLFKQIEAIDEEIARREKDEHI